MTTMSSARMATAPRAAVVAVAFASGSLALPEGIEATDLAVIDN